MAEEKRGRKSKEDLAGVPDNVVAMPVRMAPPSGLNAEGRLRWQEIVNERAADRWHKSDRNLLEQLIECEQLADRMTEAIKEHGAIIGSGSATRFGMPMENPACKIRDRTLEKMMGLQTKLRLCPSTRMRAENGANNRPPPQGRSKPWE